MYIENLRNSHEEIEEFLQKNKYKLKSPEYMFGIDNGQDPKEMFDTAKYRVLICFLSPGETRGVSNTFMALHNIVKKEMGSEVFIDYSYVPDPEDAEVFKTNHIPFWFGNVSHHPMKDYDLVMVSHSIVPESFNFARALYYSGIPLGRENRFKDDTVPFILYGGAASIVSANLLGEVPEEYGGGHSLYDAAIFGFGEDHLNVITRYLLENGIGKKVNKEEILDKATHEFNYLYDPLGYEFITDPEHPLRVKEIKKVKPWLQDKTAICNTYNTDFPGFTHKVFNLDGQNADSSDVQIALGCSGQGSCSFCSEGTVAGPFREKEFEKIKKDLDETKRMSAANSIGFYAYNLNYYSHIFELLGYAGQNFSSISLINMRVDEIANNPDFLALAKHMGQIRNSAAIEGCSERVRNNLFNKNLTRETLLTAVRTVMEQKFIMAKFGMVRAGTETEADWLEFLDTLEDMLKIRDEVGANTAFQFSFTPLVVYDNIPLRYEPRVTAQQSYEDVRNMGWVLDKVRELGDRYNCYIKCKFNGRGPGTFIEQMLLDGGRTFTKPLIRMCLDDGLDYQRNFADKHKESLVRWCKHYGIDVTDIFRERDNDEIFWSDSIQFVTETRLKEWHDMHIKHDYYHGYCLKTNSSPGKCYGCKTCPDAKAIQSIINRDLSHIPLSEVISNLAGQRVRSVTRFIINKAVSWKMYSNETLCHYVTSQFLQLDDSLVKAFHMVGKNNTSWASNNDQKDWFGGYVICDVEWKDLITAEYLKKYVDEVNKKLHIAKVVEIYDIAKNLELDTKANVSYIAEWPGITIGRVSERISNFDWMIKTIEKGASGEAAVVKKFMPELKDRLLFIPYKTGTLAFMNLPITLNPHWVMSSFMGMNEPACRQYDFKVTDVGTASDIVCKTEGCSHYANYSYILNKQLAQCPVCRGKAMLYKMSK